MCKRCAHATIRDRLGDAYRAQEREWYAARVTTVHGRDRERIKNRASYARHRAEVLARQTERRKANIQKSREQIRRYQAARRYAARTERVNPFAIYERDGGICQICRKPVDRASFSLDHIVPISRGGSHVAGNLQTSHLKCNIRRHIHGPAQIRLSI